MATFQPLPKKEKSDNARKVIYYVNSIIDEERKHLTIEKWAICKF
jgi:hypothetical protein